MQHQPRRRRLHHDAVFGGFRPDQLDWQIEAAEKAGKRIVLCVGAVKAFGYPEFFVPDHRLSQPPPEGSLVDANSHPALLAASQRQPDNTPYARVQNLARVRVVVK